QQQRHGSAVGRRYEAVQLGTYSKASGRFANFFQERDGYAEVKTEPRQLGWPRAGAGCWSWPERRTISMKPDQRDRFYRLGDTLIRIQFAVNAMCGGFTRGHSEVMWRISGPE